MPASPARILANRQNAARSTGPKTDEGKARSRANALKHGMTGEGVVIPAEDSAEVDRRVLAFEGELKPTCAVGRALVRRAAVLSVRMERGAEHEDAAVSDRVRRAQVDFVAPEGVEADEADRLRAQAGRLALFDPSRGATLARKYEAAAERGFFRSLKELRQLKKDAKAADPVAQAAAHRESLGSFLPAKAMAREFDAILAGLPEPIPAKPSRPLVLDDFADFGPRVDVPIAIGRRR